jgi:hypothetical protein
LVAITPVCCQLQKIEEKGVQTISLNSLVDELTACAVHCQHIEVDSADLGIEIGTYRTAGRHVCLHDVANNFDDIGLLETSRILVCLSDYAIPL